jgi:hypothetical protein
MLTHSPLLVAAAVCAVYLLSLGLWWGNGHSPRDFVHVGEHFINRSEASPAIRQGPVRPSSPDGFDGQFAYFIALDPWGAAPYMDNASYRYDRIAYPLAARAIVLGRADLVPLGLVAVNLLAIVGGTLALATWLNRRGVTPWTAAVFGLYPGQISSVSFDVADASGYGIAAVALWLRDRQPLASGAVFGLAGLTRETTLIFPAILLVADLVFLRRESERWRSGLALLAGGLALLPFAIWKLWLWHWLGQSGIPLSDNFTPVPFGGVLHWLGRSGGPNPVALLGTIVLPSVICLGAAAWAALRRAWLEAAMLAVNVLALVVFAGFHIYDLFRSVPRISIGVVLAAVLAMPIYGRRQRIWFWLTAVLWLSVTPVWLRTW